MMTCCKHAIEVHVVTTYGERGACTVAGCPCAAEFYCPECREPRKDHVGEKNCLPAGYSVPPRGLYDLPIFGWAWCGDGKDKRA